MITRIFPSSMKSRKSLQGEEGSALVELALSSLLLSTMLLGAVEFARVAYASIEVVNAAHSAVMYAATSSSAATDLTGIGNAAATDSPNLFLGNAVSVTSMSSVCVCSSGSNSPSSCSDNSTCQNEGASMIETVTVKTTASYSPLIHVSGVTGTSGCLGCFNLYGQSSQVVTNQ